MKFEKKVVVDKSKVRTLVLAKFDLKNYLTSLSEWITSCNEHTKRKSCGKKLIYMSIVYELRKSCIFEIRAKLFSCRNSKFLSNLESIIQTTICHVCRSRMAWSMINGMKWRSSESINYKVNQVFISYFRLLSWHSFSSSHTNLWYGHRVCDVGCVFLLCLSFTRLSSFILPNIISSKVE